MVSTIYGRSFLLGISLLLFVGDLAPPIYPPILAASLSPFIPSFLHPSLPSFLHSFFHGIDHIWAILLGSFWGSFWVFWDKQSENRAQRYKNYFIYANISAKNILFFIFFLKPFTHSSLHSFIPSLIQNTPFCLLFVLSHHRIPITYL